MVKLQNVYFSSIPARSLVFISVGFCLNHRFRGEWQLSRSMALTHTHTHTHTQTPFRTLNINLVREYRLYLPICSILLFLLCLIVLILLFFYCLAIFVFLFGSNSCIVDFTKVWTQHIKTLLGQNLTPWKRTSSQKASDQHFMRQLLSCWKQKHTKRNM